MIVTLDGQPTDVVAFFATADERAEKAGLYRLEVLHADNTRERCHALARGVLAYDRLRPIPCDGPSILWEEPPC